MIKKSNNSRKWHALSIEATLSVLGVSEKGLRTEEAAKKLLEDGLNAMPEERNRGILGIFFSQFKSPLIYVLLLAAIVVSFVGDLKDGLIIVAVLLVNALVGAIQEGKAEKTLKSLKDFSKGKAVVIRDDLEIEINAEEVVLGDILILRSGDKVAADARLLSNEPLKINESSLTGESEPVDKNPSSLKENTELLDRKNMVYRGSLVVSGFGKAVVVSVAKDTVIGGIASKLSTIESEMPLKEKVEVLSKTIGWGVLGAAILVVVVGLLRDMKIGEVFFTAVAIAVSLIPEGLPVVITLILARGTHMMAKRNALVKNMQAVEALGQANILAVDKTGTITKNELMVQKIFVNDHVFDCLGDGFKPVGDILSNKKVIDPANHPEILFAGKVAVFCADASVEFQKNGEVRVLGDPTEAALLVFGEKVGFKKDELESEEPKILEIPFNFEHKFHTTMHKLSDGENLTVIVGAPEAVLKRVKRRWTKDGEKQILDTDRSNWDKKIEEFSELGLRVLAFAVEKNKDEAIDLDHLNNLTFGGFFGLSDVLREEVPELVELARRSGVKTVMITGDFLGTAKAIAKKALIWRKDDFSLSGQELSSLKPEELDKQIGNVSVFGRVLPEHKLLIVESFKRRGDIVGMTGDGVNDALSLSAAHLGIAMGKGGTEVAKEAADIILLDNNFKSIIAAIEEGRSIYKTIKKVVLYLVSTSFGEFFTIMAALVLGLPLPVTPTQILWLNLITDGFLVVALAFEPNESLEEDDNTKDQTSILGKKEIIRAFMMGVVMMLGSLLVFIWGLANNNPATLTLSLTVLAIFQWFNAWNCRSSSKSAFYKPFSNPYLLLALLAVFTCQFFAIYNPVLQNILNTSPLKLSDWGVVIAIAFYVVIVEEIRKLLAKRKAKLKPAKYK